MGLAFSQRVPRALFRTAILAVVAFCAPLQSQIVLSGNENKIDLTPGMAAIIPGAPPDNLSILDFKTFPPSITTLAGVPNTVLGPPSNIAITPDGQLALIANSIKLDPASATNWLPHNEIHLLDLQASPPRLAGAVTAGRQPSGMSITHDGKFVFVANRADGTITVLKRDGLKVVPHQTVPVCKPEESLSDVAVSPDGRTVIASAQKGGYIALLHFENGRLGFSGRKINAFGQPYRCAITPDGELGLTAGQGFGNAVDGDALTVIDLKSSPVRTIEYVILGAVPESFEISPDGRMIAAVLMNGSNLPRADQNYSATGMLEILVREGKTFRPRQRLPIGAIPEGVAFTSGGRYLVAGCHPSRELWVFEVLGEGVRDTELRIKVPGMPSSMRAAP